MKHSSHLEKGLFERDKVTSLSDKFDKVGRSEKALGATGNRASARDGQATDLPAPTGKCRAGWGVIRRRAVGQIWGAPV